jgi:MFS transporter, DHA1 family, multidrug resistance protein
MTRNPALAQMPPSPPHFLTLVAMTALATLSLNMILPSLPAIAAEMDASYATVNLMIGGYLAMTALVLIIAGPVSDRVGRRPVVLASLAMFTLASGLCLLATDIRLLVAARLLQAAVVACSAMSLAIIRDTDTTGRAAARIARLSMAMAIAPMIGPVLGGALEQVFGWRAAFGFYTGAGFVLLALVWRDLGETGARRRGGGFGAMARDLASLARIARFWGYAICSVFSIGAFYIFLTGAPLVASQAFGLSPAAMGLVLGSITAGFFLGSALSSRIATRAGNLRMVLAGRIVACVGLSLGLVAYGLGQMTLVTYFGATISVGIGNGLTTPSANAGMLSLRPDLAGNAAGLSGAMIVAGGAALSTLTGLILRPESAAPMLLALLLAACFIGLMAALWLWRDATRTDAAI